MYEIDVVFISDSKDEYFKALTTAAIKSLLKSEDDTKIKFNVFVVESNHNIIHDNSITIHPEVPFGYNKYCNLGRSKGTAPFVVLCNNDITFEKNWALNIIKAMEQDSEIMSAGSVCPEISQSGDLKSEYIEGYLTRHYITGWMIFQKREIYNIINDLDEDFIFWYSDDYYAELLKHHKIKHVRVNTSLVHHHENSIGETANTLENIDDITHGQKKLFNSKILELRSSEFKISPLNNYFDRVYCLNLEKDKDRYKNMEKVFDYLKLNVKRWVGTTPILFNVYSNITKTITPNYLACLNSHLSIIEDALNDGLEKILILEDDIIPIKALNTKFQIMMEKNEIPNDWDMLYLSYIRTNPSKSSWTYIDLEKDKISNNIVKAKNFWSGMAYGMSKNIMERTLKYFKENKPIEIDRFYVEIIQNNIFNTYGIFPQMFAGIDNYSNNTNKNESIFNRSINNKYLQKEDFYFPN